MFPRVAWSPRARRRILTHVVVALASLAAVAAIQSRFSGSVFGWSLGCAHVSVVLLLLTLGVGPLRLLRGQSPPAQIDLRRDLGIWSGLLALVHVVVALQEHLSGRFWEYFVRRTPGGGWRVRLDEFGLANHIGLLATALALLLLLVSNDWALRRLGVRRWKVLQQATYLYAAFVFGHGVFFQWIEERPIFWVLALAASLALTLAVQLVGVLAWRRLQQRAQRPAGS